MCALWRGLQRCLRVVALHHLQLLVGQHVEAASLLSPAYLKQGNHWL